jgi:DNA-binding transcriptional ArsR family regulator
MDMNVNNIARIAALVGEPARTAMLLELADGRALTANELARAAHVGAATASRHLALMVESGLLDVTQRGRHRFHKLASAEVARMLESLMQLSTARQATPPAVVTGPRERSLRQARMCYDHIAGRLGLAISEKLQQDGAVVFADEGGFVTEHATAVLAEWGLRLEPQDANAGRRPYCRPCLDWSERKYHIAGKLGALLCGHCIEQGWLTRSRGSRALEITGAGSRELAALLGLETWSRVTEP